VYPPEILGAIEISTNKAEDFKTKKVELQQKTSINNQ
jgi:hypothetical protein